MDELLDLNAYIGHWQYWPVPQTSPKQVVRALDRWGIARAAVCSLRGYFLDWRAGNDETLEAGAAHPKRLLPFVTLSPFTGGSAADLERGVRDGAKGVRLFPLMHSYRLDHPFVDDICRAAGSLRVPVMFPTRPMMNWRFPTLDIAGVGQVAGRHPRTRFILSGPNYLVEFQAAVRVMRAHRNVSIEISCLQGFHALRRLVEAVGEGRVLFGTGLPLHYPACGVAKLARAEVPARVREAVGRRNGEKLLGLDEPGDLRGLRTRLATKVTKNTKR